jgi:uroporphyrinogen-III synthase
VNRPLAGLRVVVTRSKEGAGDLAEKLRARGAEVVLAPVIEITDPESWSALDEAMERLRRGSYEWVLFVSSNAVTKVVERAGGSGLLGGTRVAAVGPATAAALEEHGVHPEIVPESFDGATLARALGPGTGRLLLPRVAGGPRALLDRLTSLGWEVDEVDAYRNVPARPDAPGFDSVLRRDFDIVTFTSPSTVRNFVRVAAPTAVGIDPSSEACRSVACIGASTAEAARTAGVRVDVVASEHTLDGLVEAVCSLKDGSIER